MIMTTITSKDLKALRDAATQGEFGSIFISRHDGCIVSLGDGESDLENVAYDIRGYDSVYLSALSNAYRSDLLVHVDDIDEQELLDEMRAERDEARAALSDAVVNMQTAINMINMINTTDGAGLDAIAGGLDDSVHDARAALSQGEDGA